MVKFDLIIIGAFIMFSRSLISMDGLLQDFDLIRLLENFGAEVVTSSTKSFSFDNYSSSNLQHSLRTYVTSNKYTIRYLGRVFSLSYSTTEENVNESKSKKLGSSKTYICVLDMDSSLDLLQKLAQYFDTSIETYVSDVSTRFIRNLLLS